MKLTKRQLQRIIQEELEAVLNEQVPPMPGAGDAFRALDRALVPPPPTRQTPPPPTRQTPPPTRQTRSTQAVFDTSTPGGLQKWKEQSLADQMKQGPPPPQPEGGLGVAEYVTSVQPGDDTVTVSKRTFGRRRPPRSTRAIDPNWFRDIVPIDWARGETRPERQQEQLDKGAFNDLVQEVYKRFLKGN